ncbi:MAG: UDP-N-acetylmuramoyl-tripeptide--D-alanyl-D-alanine ligase [Acetobacteraceae bacterium]|nr:UDP-N-acetylmuramoyl-tripeptide--D-alanyl-D-alanine ligase [Acetobacteraceae bacterium]
MTALWDSAALAGIGAATRPFQASGVSIDTRTLAPGDLFVALVGERDGHEHASAALERGAAAVMVHRADRVPEGAPALVVDDTLAGLHGLGAAGRARFGGRVVAVTGSVGKTTTKEMLRAALGAFGATHAAEASYNNHWGVPLTLARLPADAAFCVCEIGMNNPGEIEPLARLASPDVAVITNIEAAHIGRLGSLEAIADEKGAIFRGLRQGGRAVLPADSAQFERLRSMAGAGLTFGRAEWADVRVHGDEVSVAGQRLRLPLAAPGAHLRVNAAAAIAAVVALGLDPIVATAHLADFRPLGGRGLQRRLGAVTLLDESYNANTASMRAALAVLREMPGTRRLAVLGDMLELGEFGPAEHRGLAADVAGAADLLYACGPLMRHLFDAVPAAQRGVLAADSASLAPIVADAVRPGDAVLIKGSLGSRMRVIVGGLEARLSEGPP